MISMNIHWDNQTMDFIARFNESFGLWDEYMYHNLSEDLAKKMVDFIKSNVRSKTNVWGGGSGESEKSVRSNTNIVGNGFEISFWGNLGALYMDQGNFPAGEVLDAAEYGLSKFPVGKRNTGSALASMKFIHGMGHTTPSTPTYYSDTATDDWSKDDYTHLAADSLELWLNEVISG